MGRRSRRRFLRLSLAGLAGGLAGCSFPGGGGEEGGEGSGDGGGGDGGGEGGESGGGGEGGESGDETVIAVVKTTSSAVAVEAEARGE